MAHVLHFFKMHGIGNDYVFIDCTQKPIESWSVLPHKLAAIVSDRHRGIGGDGLVLICLPTKSSIGASVRMRMFNADGSEAEMCGNAVRCVAKYSYEKRLAKAVQPTDAVSLQFLSEILLEDAYTVDEIGIETGNGVLSIQLVVQHGRVGMICVDMGSPNLSPQAIPVNYHSAINVPIELPPTEGKVESFLAICVSVGNPHAVIFCDDLDKIDLTRVGPLIETASIFPSRINVHFVQCVSEREVHMRTWERGSGITQACGTGATAVCIAGVLSKRTQQRILVHLSGGDLHLFYDPSIDHAYMAGTATMVFSGELDLNAL